MDNVPGATAGTGGGKSPARAPDPAGRSVPPAVDRVRESRESADGEVVLPSARDRLACGSRCQPRQDFPATCRRERAAGSAWRQPGDGARGGGIRLLRTFGEGLIPRVEEIHSSASVTLFAVAAALATTLVFGLAPALKASRSISGHRPVSGPRRRRRHDEHKRGLLVAIEVGLASFLLVGAGLLGESLVRLLSTGPGLRTDHLLTLRLTLSRSRFPTNPAQNAFFREILDKVAALPGVLDAGEISETPLKGNNPQLRIRRRRRRHSFIRSADSGRIPRHQPRLSERRRDSAAEGPGVYRRRSRREPSGRHRQSGDGSSLLAGLRSRRTKDQE